MGVAAFEDEVMVYRLSFGVSSQELVLNNNFNSETTRAHARKWTPWLLKPLPDTIASVPFE